MKFKLLFYQNANVIFSCFQELRKKYEDLFIEFIILLLEKKEN